MARAQKITRNLKFYHHRKKRAVHKFIYLEQEFFVQYIRIWND